MLLAAAASHVTWFAVAVVLLAAGSLLSWGVRLEAAAERERRGLPPLEPTGIWASNRARTFGVAAALTTVTLGAIWIWDVPRIADAEASSHAAHSVLSVRAHPAAHHALAVSSVLTHPAAHRALAKALAASAAMPAAPSGAVAHVRVTVEDRTIEIAPGVRYQAWTFNGHVPGPTIHVRQGQRVDVTFTNNGTMAHSLDFHAARVAPDQAFKDVLPGHSLHFRFVAERPGVFLYHCVTAPAVAHIANGMYGAMIVDPKKALPPARSFVLTAAEWYTDGQTPAHLDYGKALAAVPDWTTFNGRAFQYDDAALHVKPGERVRFYVLNAGPNNVLPFHLVGGIFDRAYPDGDMTHWLRDVQTTDVAPGGAAIFDARFPAQGVYGFVSHSFANAEKGAVGTVLVGAAHGAMSH